MRANDFSHAVGPHFQDIQTELEALSALADKPSGNVRITAGLHVTETILWPKLQPLLRKYPEIHVEIIVDYGLANIVADRFDAGVRLGEQVAKDMIAVRIGPDFRMVVVAAPSYFSNRRAAPHAAGSDRPQLHQPAIAHLRRHLRRGSSSEADAKSMCASMGSSIFNSSKQILDAALAGFGLAYLPEDTAAPHLERGRLVQVLDPWCAPFPGYHIYYPSRRQSSPAFQLVVDALRYKRK